MCNCTTTVHSAQFHANSTVVCQCVVRVLVGCLSKQCTVRALDLVQRGNQLGGACGLGPPESPLVTGRVRWEALLTQHFKCREEPVVILQPIVTVFRDCWFQITALCLVPSCRHHLPDIFSLATPSAVISLCYRTFLPACLSLWKALSVRPSSFSAFFFSKFLFRLVVLQHVSASVSLRRGSCCYCPDFGFLGCSV